MGYSKNSNGEVVAFEQDFLEMLMSGGVDLDQTDNDGQIVIYTGVYKWADGSLHTEPEHE